MKKLRRFSLSRLSSGQSGQAFILVLIFLMLGSLTLVPTLTHISTALKTGEVYEQNTNELYTADAGIEDSLWRIKYDFMGEDYNPYDFKNAFPYQTEDINGMTANFTIMNVWFPTNANLVDPYAPGYISMTPDEVTEMMESEKLVVSGSTLPGQPYRILIDFNPDEGDNLTVKSLGVWLPSGFTYSGNCSLQLGGQFTAYNPDHITSAEAPGGWTVLWSYDPPDYPYLADFPGFDGGDMTFDFTFNYTPPAEHPNWRPAAVAWITAEMHDADGNPKLPLDSPENVPVSWDIDTRYFKMISEAGDTAIEAYTSKNELRQMGDAMSGDYVAIGNSLLSDDDGDYKRTNWHTPGWFDLNDPTDNVSIPANADAVYAFLYWSGWRNENAIQNVSPFPDVCSNFNNWTRISENPQNVNKVPTGDGITSGTWNTSPYWSNVDETTPNDTDYITGTTGNQINVPTGDGDNSGSWNYTPSSPSNYYSKVDETTPDDSDYTTGTKQNQVRVPTGDGISSGSWSYTGGSGPYYYSRVDETTPNDSDYVTGTTDSGGYRLFTFPAFTVPADDTIDGLTIYFQARDISGTNPNNNLYASVRVNGNLYDASSSIDPTTTWTTYNYTFTTNPATSAPWTWQEINGGSSNPLQQFGVRSTAFNPDIQVSMVYAQVDYSGGYRLFTFPAFTVPADSTIDNLTINFRARDASGTNPNNNLYARLRVGGSYYDAASSVDPTTTWTTYSYTFTTNPRTGAAWTWQDINGSGSNPLQQFGVRSTDLNPDIQVSMVYAQVGFSGGGYELFTFSAFSLPSTAVVTNLTIYFRAKDASGTNPNNNLCASIRVNGTRYDAASSVDPASEWTTYSYSFDTNPETPGVAWTYADINGTGSHPLQQFGIRSTDLNPDIQVSMVYAQVNYEQSPWTISSDKFRGTGSSSTDPDPRTLTLKNSLNLGSYANKTVAVSWEESSSQNLEPGDAMYFAFSGDGGLNWSDNIEAFHGNVVDDRTAPPASLDKGYKLFSYSVPEEYVTGDFLMRFYFNFDGTDEYVNIDNIKIRYLTPDTSITFKIGNDQVYFDGSEPADGLYPLTAGRSYAKLNTMWGDPYGYSYMCVRDVSALVKKYPIPTQEEEHHTGNAIYTVDAVTADTTNPNGSLSDFAFAGWSLIIVYACPETAGHYIYIRDDTFAFHPGTGGNLDFDEDGKPGGTITGFKVPNPITDAEGEITEKVAAKLTCFIVEGDNFLPAYVQDSSSIVVTGQQSKRSKSLTNPSCEIDDVWNGRSYPGTYKEGVDIDTFDLKWSDNILTPKDKELQVDMFSLNDAWNLVYFIISIRSETTTSGTTHYTIYGN